MAKGEYYEKEGRDRRGAESRGTYLLYCSDYHYNGTLAPFLSCLSEKASQSLLTITTFLVDQMKICMTSIARM
jgi:hypothetical protein